MLERIYAIGKIDYRVYIIKADMIKLPSGGYSIIPLNIYYPPDKTKKHVEGTVVKIDFMAIYNDFIEAQYQYCSLVRENIPSAREEDYEEVREIIED